MRFLPFLLIITPPLFMACDQNKYPNERKTIIEQVSFTVEEEDVPPPPPELTSRFRSIEEWLSHLCNNEKPDSSVTTYQFGLFKYHSSSYAVSLVGIKEYSSDTNTVRRILFEPAEMYYPLPDSTYKGLSWQEANDKLTVQLKEFTHTSKFRESFFAKAPSIITGYNGAKIWSQ